ADPRQVFGLHAGAAIEDGDDQLAPDLDLQTDLIGRSSGLGGVLEQVDEHLLNLGTIKVSRYRERRGLDLEGIESGELRQERLPFDRGFHGRGKPGELRVPIEE